jgi:hypothetical protein
LTWTVAVSAGWSLSVTTDSCSTGVAGEYVAEIIEVIAAAVAQLTVLGSPERGHKVSSAADGANPLEAENTECSAARKRPRRKTLLIRWGVVVAVGVAAGVATALTGGIGAGLVAAVLVAAAAHDLMREP